MSPLGISLASRALLGKLGETNRKQQEDSTWADVPLFLQATLLKRIFKSDLSLTTSPPAIETQYQWLPEMWLRSYALPLKQHPMTPDCFHGFA